MADHREQLDGEDVVAFADAARWESWLAEHHGQTAGVWVKIAKKHSGERSVTISEALDVALCFGWIDSQRKTCDQAHYMQRYSPRRPTSAWSQINIGKFEALVAAGRMREAGLAAFRRGEPV
jgi:uncharacterized protein YdeI (YjbR/CyaY-like superfamily)